MEVHDFDEMDEQYLAEHSDRKNCDDSQTATKPEPIDLAPMLALHAAATPGHRKAVDHNGTWKVRTDDSINALVSTHEWGVNALADVALHNAFPALAAELRTLRESRELLTEAGQRHLANYQTAEAERTALAERVHNQREEINRLRARVALKEIADHASGIGEYKGEGAEGRIANRALASTPDQHRQHIVAGGLRDLARKMPYHAEWLLAEADRLAKEAGNVNNG